MSGTWASGWALNDIVTAGEFAKGVGCVADTTLGIAAASFDFTSLPSTYAHLIIVLYARGDLAATTVNVFARFNNDNTANYDYQQTSASAAATTVSESFGQTSMFVGNCAGSTAGANLFGHLDILTSNYANASNNKLARALWAQKIGTASGNLQAGAVTSFWRSNAAINRITLLPGTGNFVAGSRCSIYAMGA